MLWSRTKQGFVERKERCVFYRIRNVTYVVTLVDYRFVV